MPPLCPSSNGHGGSGASRRGRTPRQTPKAGPKAGQPQHNPANPGKPSEQTWMPAPG